MMIENNGIYSNTEFAVRNDAGVQVNAMNNWWGSNSDPASAISGSVVFTPWLTSQCACLTGGTNVSGNITLDTVWTLSGSPYIVTDNINVYGTDGSDGITTLTIEPGVDVKFDAGKRMYISGSGGLGVLVARGSESLPIRFTANSDNPDPGYWGHINIKGNPSGNATIMDHCIIEYGGWGVNAVLFIDQSSPAIQNSVLRYNSWGIWNFGGSPTITGNTIHDNDTVGILTQYWGNGPVTRTTIIDNTITGNRDGLGVMDGNVIIQGNTIAGNRKEGLSFDGYYAGESTITGNTISKNLGTGIDIGYETEAQASLLTIRCNKVLNNQTGIYVNSINSINLLNIVDNSICSNTSYAVRNDSGIEVDVDNNWWGSANDPGSSMSGSVHFSPWLTYESACLTGGTEVSGVVSLDTTWTLAGSPYFVTGDVSVVGTDGSDGITTLTIEPGVDIRFNAGKQLYIGNEVGGPGALVAQGTETSPIKFTANTTNPTPGFWSSITLNGPASMDHCIVEYGGGPGSWPPYSCEPGSSYDGGPSYTGNINCFGANNTITIQNSIIRYSGCHGITTNTSKALITGNTITDNNSTGIHIVGYGPTISNNIISNSGVYGIYSGPSIAKITHNTIIGSGTYGVMAEWIGNTISSGFVFNENTLSNNGQYDFYTLGTGNLIFVNDVFNTGTYTPNCTVSFVDNIAPDNVRNLQARCTQTGLVFTWTPSLNLAGDLAGYRVYFNGDSQGVQIGPDQTSYEVSGLSPASSYLFRITAYDTSGNESAGVETTGYTILSNPANLTVTPRHGYVTLTWQAVEPAANVQNYRVYMSETNFTSVEGMAPCAYPTGTTADVSGLQNGVPYYFAVTTVNKSGDELKTVTTVSATPIADISGPSVSDLKLNGTAFGAGNVMTRSGSFTVSATDISRISKVEYSLDGSLVGTYYSAPFSAYLSIEGLSDGIHTLRITAYDTYGNSTGIDYTVQVQLAPPYAPVISQPASGLVTNKTDVVVSGTAEKNSSVVVYLGGTAVGEPIPVGNSGTFSRHVTLAQGDNLIHAAAQNRAGEGPSSNEVAVTVDASVPDAPQSLIARAATGGTIALSWYRPLKTSVTGYNIYRFTSPFTDRSLAVKINNVPVKTTAYQDLPPAQGTYYYRAACMNAIEVESVLSNEAAATSDSVLPRAVSVQYTPHGRYDSATGRFAPGIVDVTVNVSEKLETAPFFSITPFDGNPILVGLNRESDLVYKGIFTIAQDTPSGDANAVFSARDLAGNRGTEIGSGGSIKIDTEAPRVNRIQLLPGSLIKNDQQNPVNVTVTIGLDGHMKSGTAPELTYLLSQDGRISTSVGTLTQITAEGNDIETWQATFALPADAGLTQAESIRFTSTCTDDLDNSTTCIVPGSFQVYQGELPPLGTPSGLIATSLPSGQIKLKWNEVKDAVAYQIYRKAPIESELTEYMRVNASLEAVDTPTSDGIYTYAIASIHQANGQESKSGMSSPVTVVSDATPPGMPQNLNLTLASDGIHATWQEPATGPEALTYALYRSNGTQITSIEGLTPILTGITTTSAVDVQPSPSDHCYVVVALDMAGNRSMPSESFYLNFSLLPVSSLKVVQSDTAAPVVTWTHPGGSVIGYNFFVGPEANRVKVNTSPMTALSYTDTGFTGKDRIYTVTAEDSNNVQSLDRSITLPEIKASMSEIARVRRGIMNRVEYLVENSSANEVKNIRIHALIKGRDHVSEQFTIAAGQKMAVPVIIGGYADLQDTEQLVSTIAITPKEKELIEISRTSDIQVGDAVMALQIFNEAFTRGGTGKVTFSIQNTSDSEVEVVTAEQSGESASRDLAFKLLDNDGNVLSTVSYKQVFGEGTVMLSTGFTVVRIPAGATFVSDPVTIAVPASAPDQVEVKFDIAYIYYHKDKPEQVKMAGPSFSRSIFLVDTAYYGRIAGVTPENSSGEQDIVITGQAIERATSSPMSHVPLRLVIEVNGFERKIDIFTDSSGGFSYTFIPLAGESGEYHVYAVHPDVTENPVQAIFTISRVSFKPKDVNLNLARNQEQVIEVNVSTGSVTSVNNLRLEYNATDQDGGSLPQGVHIVLGDAVPFMDLSKTMGLAAFVWIDNDAGQNSKAVLRVVSDERVWGTVNVNIRCSANEPVLKSVPEFLETGVNHDTTAVGGLALVNEGIVECRDIHLDLLSVNGSPAPTWAHLNTVADLGLISAGYYKDINLSFSPPTGTTEGLYNMVVRVTSSNHSPVNIPVHVTVTSSQVGNVLFKVKDIFTGTLDTNGDQIQGLAQAQITITKDSDPGITQNLQSDSMGEAYFTNLPAGLYNCRIASKDHSDYQGRFWIQPGITVNHEALLAYAMVNVEWAVKETTTKDYYTVVTNVTYKTEVPAAVIVASPKTIYLHEMNPGQVFTAEVTYTNYGLIRSDNLNIVLPKNNAYLSFEVLGEVPQSLDAKQSVTIPIRITCLKSMSSQQENASGGDSYMYSSSYDYTYDFWYTYTCSDGKTYSGIEKVHIISIVTQGSVYVPSIISGGGTSGGGTYYGGGGGSYSGGSGSYSGGGGSYSGGGGSYSGGGGYTSGGSYYSGGYISGGGGSYSGGSGSYSGGGSYGSGSGSSSGSASSVVCTATFKCAVNDACCRAYTSYIVRSEVDAITGQYLDESVDLFIKVPGYRLSVVRRYYNSSWHFRLSDIDQQLDFEYGLDGVTPTSITKDGVPYTSTDDLHTVFSFGPNHYIFVITEGYRYEDNSGNWSIYDSKGRLTSYGNKDNLKVSLIYEQGENGRLIGARDNSDQQVIWYDYDAQGNLSAVRDAWGRSVSYTYTAENRLSTVTDLLGYVTQYFYDITGKISSKIDPASETTYVEYNDFEFVKTVRGDSGFRKDFEYGYDEAKQEHYTKITYNSGRIEEAWYNSDGKRIRKDINGKTVESAVFTDRNKLIINAEGNRTYRTYDEWRNMIEEAYPDGTVDRYKYIFTRKGFVISEKTDRAGVRHVYSYDGFGNVIRIVDAAGTTNQSVKEFTYDSQGRMLTEKTLGDANTPEALSSYAYDNKGNLISRTDSEGNTTTFTYDHMGNVLTSTDPLNHTIHYFYDAKGRLVSVTDPAGNITRKYYDAAGNVIKDVDALGHEKNYVYDHDNRLISTTDALGNTTTYNYDADGRLIRQVGPEGAEISNVYNVDGRLMKTIDPNGIATTNEYMDGGQAGCTTCTGASFNKPSRVLYPSYTKEFNYDSLGRKILEREVLSETQVNTTIYEYDHLGNVVSVTDREGKTTHKVYDELNRLVKVTNARGDSRSFGYDIRGNMTSITDGNGNITRMEYDRNKRLKKLILPMGQETSYIYNGAGNLIRKVDAKGQVEEYEYNDAGKAVLVKYFSATDHTTPVKTVSYTYNSFGNMLTYADGTTSAEYTYDALNRKVSENVNYGSFSLSYSYTYTRSGMKKSFTGADGITYEYTYDIGGRIKNIGIPGHGFITYNDYAWNRPASMTLPGGIVKNFTYDPLMRYTEIKTDDRDNNVMMDYDYTHDRMDNILSKSTEHGNYAYAYDDIYQLIHADNPGTQDETYTYDSAGNRLTSFGVQGTWTYNRNNELVGYGDITFEYDANGNMIRKTQGTQVTNYSYDVSNRLIKVEDGSGGVIARYYYDPFGKRLWKDVSGTKTYFFYADEGLVGEYSASGAQIKAYGYKPNSQWTTDPLFMKAGSQYYFYHNDHMGTPQRMTDINGTVVWSAKYDSFGKASIDPASSMTNNLRFPGQYYDVETGLAYNYNRYYSPEIGSYIIRDPKLEMAMAVAYAYCENNPINKFDSLGLAADGVFESPGSPGTHESYLTGSGIWDTVFPPYIPGLNFLHFIPEQITTAFLWATSYLGPVPIIGDILFSFASHLDLDAYSNAGVFYPDTSYGIAHSGTLGPITIPDRTGGSSNPDIIFLTDTAHQQEYQEHYNPYLARFNQYHWTNIFSVIGNYLTSDNAEDAYRISSAALDVWANFGPPPNLENWSNQLSVVIKNNCAW